MRAICSKLNSKDIKVIRESLGDLQVKMDLNRPLVEDNIVKVRSAFVLRGGLRLSSWWESLRHHDLSEC